MYTLMVTSRGGAEEMAAMVVLLAVMAVAVEEKASERPGGLCIVAVMGGEEAMEGTVETVGKALH